jgi:hypothetical protein
MYTRRSAGPVLAGRFAGACAAALALSFAIAACGSSPTAPSTPPVVVNTPPVIDSVTVSSARAEADQSIQVSASVKDAETPLDQLTYVWSATPHNGTFTGTGASVSWRAPKGETSPDTYTITLTVTEHFTSAGKPLTNVTASSTTVHYNDSNAETVGLGSLFLKDFGTFSVSPEECVRNFADQGIDINGRDCSREKADELSQIQYNRSHFHILSSTFTATVVNFNASQTLGEVDGPCVFEDIPNEGETPPLTNAGKRELVAGTCQLTTIYQNFQWRLCESHFNAPYNTTLESLIGRVPGRVRFQTPY